MWVRLPPRAPPNLMSDTPPHRTRYSPWEERTYEIPDEAIPPSPKRVLILEDDPGVTRLLAGALQEQGYHVTAVANGADGLRQVMAADFDAVVCDMVIPSLAGDMFYLAVERTRPHLCPRFIFMTCHKADRRWAEFARSKGCLLLFKPFEMHVFLETVRLVANKSEAKPS